MIDPHSIPESTGVLLVNLGTPSEPSPKAIRTFLAEFLSDRRVVERCPWMWQPMLRAVILPLRSHAVAEKYAQIWMKEGSPLRVYSKQLTDKLQARMAGTTQKPINIVLAMRYGNPSIEQGIQTLREANANHMIVLPLYPQYSATTTASIFDAVTAVFKHQRYIPQLTFIHQYADHPAYISALAQTIQQHWAQHGRGEKLLFSFHGLPQTYCNAGDPYGCYCIMTAEKIAAQLQLSKNTWEIVFQSRFGRSKWLEPACDIRLIELAQSGVKKVDVICPGFAVDCLETLEEIAITNKNKFLEAGGQQFHYIPALNAQDKHVTILQQLIERSL